MYDLDARLTSLFESFESLNIKDYLNSSNFNNLCERMAIKSRWEEELVLFKRDIAIEGFFTFENTYYANGAFKYLLNTFFIHHKNRFDDIVYEVITDFISYLNKVKDFDEVFSNLKTLNFDIQRLEELRTLHAEKQASLAFQVEQQVSPQVTVLPTPTPKEVAKENIIKAVEKNDYVTATSLLRKQNLDTVQKNTLSKLEQELVSDGINFSFTQRFLIFVNTVFNK